MLIWHADSQSNTISNPLRSTLHSTQLQTPLQLTLETSQRSSMGLVINMLYATPPSTAITNPAQLSAVQWRLVKNMSSTQVTCGLVCCLKTRLTAQASQTVRYSSGCMTCSSDVEVGEHKRYQKKVFFLRHGERDCFRVLSGGVHLDNKCLLFNILFWKMLLWNFSQSLQIQVSYITFLFPFKDRDNRISHWSA